MTRDKDEGSDAVELIMSLHLLRRFNPHNVFDRFKMCPYAPPSRLS